MGLSRAPKALVARPLRTQAQSRLLAREKKPPVKQAQEQQQEDDGPPEAPASLVASRLQVCRHPPRPMSNRHHHFCHNSRGCRCWLRRGGRWSRDGWCLLARRCVGRGSLRSGRPGLRLVGSCPRLCGSSLCLGSRRLCRWLCRPNLVGWGSSPSGVEGGATSGAGIVHPQPALGASDVEAVLAGQAEGNEFVLSESESVFRAWSVGGRCFHSIHSGRYLSCGSCFLDCEFMGAFDCSIRGQWS